MAPYNLVAEGDIRSRRREFVSKIVDGRGHLVSFVDERLGWDGAGQFDGFYKGSFNICLKVRRSETDECALIRFPAPGNIYAPWRDEKVQNDQQTNKLFLYTSLCS